MESLVFGDPISEETLKSNQEYANKKLTSTDIAQIALNMKNTGGKNIAALNHAKALKNKLGITIGVVTVGVIYNATGKNLTYVTSHDYNGHLGPLPYPKTLKNGQWGVFVHKNTPGSTTGSRAAIVYRGQKEQNGCVCKLVNRDWVMAWDNPAETNKNCLDDKNVAYTEVREPAPFDDKRWNQISSALSMSGPNCSDEYDDCWSYVSIGKGDDAVFEALMTVNKS